MHGPRGFSHPFNRLDDAMFAIGYRLDLRCRRPELNFGKDFQGGKPQIPLA